MKPLYRKIQAMYNVAEAMHSKIKAIERDLPVEGDLALCLWDFEYARTCLGDAEVALARVLMGLEDLGLGAQERDYDGEAERARLIDESGVPG